MPSNEGMKTAAVAMSRMPKLGIKFLVTFMKFKRRTRKSAKVFRRSLVRSGMDRQQAKELAEAYEVTFSVRKLIKEGDFLPSNIFN
jgi:hypothetical protein